MEIGDLSVWPIMTWFADSAPEYSKAITGSWLSYQ